MERIAYKWDPAERVREYPEGPWDAEDDKVQWPDPATGLACLIKRNRYGVWCGYVGVDDTHPFYGKGYQDEPDVEVHGGLTYAEACQDGNERYAICHIPGPGEPEPLWWFGFDCGHGEDVSPGMLDYYEEFNVDMSYMNPTYKTQAWVTAETQKLAAQIALATEKG